MLEAIAAAVLNRYFGDYLDNFNSSHLDFSLWRGDIIAKDVRIKSTAINHFKLPFQVVAGNVGKLEMKIPWKYIYSEPVEILLKDVHLVAVHSNVVPYDSVTEQHDEFKYKMAQLESLEEIYRVILTRRQSFLASKLKESIEASTAASVDDRASVSSTSSRRSSTSGSHQHTLSYMEKLIEHIIRNLKVTVESIHIRYEEEKVTGIPYSVGIVLSSLTIECTDEDWISHYFSEETPTSFKVVHLDGLAVYINSGENLTAESKNPTEKAKIAMIKRLGELINSDDTNLQYIVGPISTVIHVSLTKYPEELDPEFSQPKLNAEIAMEKLSLGISSTQFKNILHLLQSVEFMIRTQTWRKYRPNTDRYKGNYKLWWDYAITCSLVEVRRKKQNWSWDNMLKHRESCKQYLEMYYKHLLNGQIGLINEEKIKHLEKELDLANLVILRKLAEIKLDRQQRFIKRRSSGWFSSFMGWNITSQPTPDEFNDHMNAEWTPEEKTKIKDIVKYMVDRAAIQKDKAATDELPSIIYPVEYVDFKAHFTLNLLNLIIKENENLILLLKIEGIEKRFEHRPVNNGINLNFHIQTIEIHGAPPKKKNEVQLYLMRTQGLESDQKFLTVQYEKCPLDTSAPADERLVINGTGIELIYHATPINQLISCFETPQEIAIYKVPIEGAGAGTRRRSSSAEHDAIIHHQYTKVNTKPKKPLSLKETIRKARQSLTFLQAKNLEFSMDFSLKSCHLIFVEDKSTVKTNSIIVYFEISSELVSSLQELKGNGLIDDLSIHTCNYSSIYKSQKLAEVLSPTKIGILINKLGKRHADIEIDVTDIFIRMSAGTVELITHLADSIEVDHHPHQRVVGHHLDSATKEGDYSRLWETRDIKEFDFTFIKADKDRSSSIRADEINLGVKDSHYALTPLMHSAIKHHETLTIYPINVTLTFEVGTGVTTIPLLLVETCFDFQAFDWSRKIRAEGAIQIVLAYNNTKFGSWEYLIEPVEVGHQGAAVHKPWKLTFEIMKSNSSTRAEESHYQSRTSLDLSIMEAADDHTRTQIFMILLHTEDILELTVTKTSLEVIKTLEHAFSSTSIKSLVTQHQVSKAPYIFINDTGEEITLDLNNGSLVVLPENLDENLYNVHSKDLVIIPSGTRIYLQVEVSKARYSILKEQDGRIERRVRMAIPTYDFIDDIPLNRSEDRYFPFVRTHHSGLRCGIVCEVGVQDCSVVVTIRSLLKIVNQMNIPLNVLVKDESGTFHNVGLIEENGVWNVPVSTIYDNAVGFYFCAEDYLPSETLFDWPLLKRNPNMSALVKCVSETPGDDHILSMKAVGSCKEIMLKNKNHHTAETKAYEINIWPILTITNFLPVPLIFTWTTDALHPIAGDERISASGGESLQVLHDQSKNGVYEFGLMLENYEGNFWTSKITMSPATPKLSSWAFTGTDRSVIYVGIRKQNIVDDTNTLHVYSPFWMINLTGLNLSYKGEEKSGYTTNHSAQFTGPVIFSMDGKNFFSQKRAQVKITDSEWSDKFYLDLSGNTELVTCRAGKREYQFEVSTTLSAWGLTKLVSFSPRYFLINHCTFDVKFREKEDPPGSEITLQQHKCIPFWPKSKNSFLVVGVTGMIQTSAPFHYDRIHTSMLPLPNQYGGIHVSVHASSTRTTITFSVYKDGSAPVLLVNNTDEFSFEFCQQDNSKSSIVLGPDQCQLFTWSHPSGKRVLEWTAVGKGQHVQNKLLADGAGEIKLKRRTGEERVVHWLSFLEGFQRVLLFTTDLSLSTMFELTKDEDFTDIEILISMSGVGLSLVDNDAAREIIYGRISSSGVLWEASREGSQRYRPIEPEHEILIEPAFAQYQEQKLLAAQTLRPPHPIVTLMQGVIEVDFSTMRMSKPFKRILRRSPLQPGIWFHFKKFPTSIQIHFKLNHLQIDNQLPDCTFRYLLTPVEPPKSITSESEAPKPFVNISFMQYSTAHSTLLQVIFCSILIQEFHVRTDMGFVNAILRLFDTKKGKSSIERLKESFQKDVEVASVKLSDYLSHQIKFPGSKMFFEKLHLSPIKVHLSFSMIGAGQDLNSLPVLLLHSIGVSLADAQDVVFKLDCLELKHMFVTNEQLGEEIGSHYALQALKQLYAWIFGLDVIGNPIGLVSGVTEGIEAFFYEPIQGATMGPEEFAEGLSLGVKSLVGHTVGGAADALSKITGTIGKGLAVLTMDEDYQRTRMENISKRNEEGFLSHASNFFSSAIVGTVTGVVTNPIEGAKKEGIQGFGKGLLKGTLGLVARPITGAADLASGTLSVLKRVAQDTQDLTQIRPPRDLEPNTRILPYTRQTAEGLIILNELKNGKSYLEEEEYIAHVVVTPKAKVTHTPILLMTTSYAFFLTLHDAFGGSKVLWEHKWDEFEDVPDIQENEPGLIFRVKAAAASSERGLFRKKPAPGQKLFVACSDPKLCVWILSKVGDAMEEYEKIKLDLN